MHVPPPMNILHMVIPILMHCLAFISQIYILHQMKYRQQRKTTMLPNHKRRYSDGISQNIPLQILNVIKSDVKLYSYSPVHLNVG